MKEYFSEAIVLGDKPFKEYDRKVNLYTKSLGRVEAKVVGGRKIISKLAPHLDALNFVKVRLIQKNQFTLTDVIADNRFSQLRENSMKLSLGLRLLFLIRSLLPELAPDLSLWHGLLRSLKTGRIELGFFLKLFGYDPASAYCENCRLKNVDYFVLSNQRFVCSRCGLKLPETELIFLR